ncbi:MAG: hypothetical protein HYT80_11520 [Euryarchaeota archaeon]|nr:hypothetical protein [Euryarchaeota archaeon]
MKLERAKTPSWDIEAVGQDAQLPGGKASILEARLTPRPDAGGLVAPALFNLTSDVGGRVGLVAHLVNGVPAVAAEGAAVSAGKVASAPAEAPGPAFVWVAVALLGLGLALARHRP